MSTVAATAAGRTRMTPQPVVTAIAFRAAFDGALLPEGGRTPNFQGRLQAQLSLERVGRSQRETVAASGQRCVITAVP